MTEAIEARGLKRRWQGLLAAALCAAALVTPSIIFAGEGGTTHVQPGANATLVDVPATKPGGFIKPIYLNYRADATAQIPTAAGLVGNLDATANIFILGGGYTFERTILDGAHYTLAAFLPYSWLDVSANVETPLGTVRRESRVSGLGDLTAVPVMLAWKGEGSNWQFSALLPIYAPTGDYEQGRLGNPGLNYWTFDPTFGVTYSNPKIGFNAMLNTGFAYNTENRDTKYQSGSLLHLDGAIQQVLPIGKGMLTVGAEGFYLQQVTCDGGSGAVLGCFKGRTAGLGPVLGYILPLGQQSLAFELKWLREIEVRNRLEGDYSWLKVVYKF